MNSDKFEFKAQFTFMIFLIVELSTLMGIFILRVKSLALILVILNWIFVLQTVEIDF